MRDVHVLLVEWNCSTLIQGDDLVEDYSRSISCQARTTWLGSWSNSPLSLTHQRLPRLPYDEFRILQRADVLSQSSWVNSHNVTLYPVNLEFFNWIRIWFTQVKDHPDRYPAIQPSSALMTQGKQTATEQQHCLNGRNGGLIQCFSQQFLDPPHEPLSRGLLIEWIVVYFWTVGKLWNGEEYGVEQEFGEIGSGTSHITGEY